MVRRGFAVFGFAAVALAALALTPSSASAQRRGGGGYRGGGAYRGGAMYRGGYASRGWSGYRGGWNGGYGGYRGWNGGYGGYGRRGWGGYGWGGWGWGLAGLGLGLGLDYALTRPYGYGGYYGSYPYYDYGSYPYYDSGYYPSYSDDLGYTDLYPEGGYASSYYPSYSYDQGYTAGYPESSYSYSTYPTESYAPDYYGTPAASTAQPAANDDARLRVVVPPNAQVWFEGQPTRQRGSVRYFESPPLNPGQDYSYDIRAQWQQDGRTVDQTRQVDVQAGDSVTVDFSRPPQAER